LAPFFPSNPQASDDRESFTSFFRDRWREMNLNSEDKYDIGGGQAN